MTETAVMIPEEWSWLPTICDPDKGYLPTIKPWRVGQRVVATNGRVLVSIVGDFADDADAEVSAKLLKVLDQPPMSPPHPVDWQAIRDFVGPVVVAPPCTTCNGKGVLSTCDACDNSGEVECECDCGDEHFRKCDECNGKGEVLCPECTKRDEADPVCLGWSVFNRKLIAPVVSRLDATEVQLAQDAPEGMAWFTSPSWTLIMMPMRVDSRSTYPKLELRRPTAGLPHGTENK